MYLSDLLCNSSKSSCVKGQNESENNHTVYRRQIWSKNSQIKRKLEGKLKVKMIIMKKKRRENKYEKNQTVKRKRKIEVRTTKQ